jgi:hypothetical protein
VAKIVHPIQALRCRGERLPGRVHKGDVANFHKDVAILGGVFSANRIANRRKGNQIQA